MRDLQYFYKQQVLAAKFDRYNPDYAFGEWAEAVTRGLTIKEWRMHQAQKALDEHERHVALDEELWADELDRITKA